MKQRDWPPAGLPWPTRLSSLAQPSTEMDTRRGSRKLKNSLNLFIVGNRTRNCQARLFFGHCPAVFSLKCELFDSIRMVLVTSDPG